MTMSFRLSSVWPLLVVLSLTVLGLPASAANGSVTYTYDPLGRVSTASYDTGVIVLYTYDANGNRTQQTINVNTATLCWNNTTGCSPTSKTALWDQGLWH
jgi:YD repeat-containing protein